MALVIADRVLETTTTTGTGAVALGGAPTGYRTFGSGIGNSNTTYYTIAGQSTSEWEVGLGTLDGTSANLTRTTVLASSNAGSAVSFSAGTKNVFCTYAATKGVYLDASGNVSALGTVASGVWQGTLIGTAYGGTGQSSALTQYGVVYGSTTTAMATTAAGTSTTVLHGNAAGAPTFGAVSLTADVSGILPIANGGTNASTASVTSLNNITGYAFAGITGNTSTYSLVGSNTPTLTTPNIGAATGTSVVLTGAISSSSASAGIGYATGAGEALTQLTSTTTGVTSGNKMTGTITLFSGARANQTNVAFTFTNTSIASTDLVIVNHISAGTLGAYNITVTPASGSATITLRNISGGSLTEAPVLKYLVLKAVVA
jgi:hypothetical protein